MNRSLKTLLLWLLIAALPLQGFAAAVQHSCAPSHHAAAAQAHQHDAHAQHHQAEHHHAVPSHHAGASQDHQVAHDGNTSCSSCASCCLGVAMTPPISLNAHSAAPSEAVHLSPPQLLLGYVPPNLERPPKHISA